MRPHTGSIRGTVTSAHGGAPIPGASVRLTAAILPTESDEAGNYSFENVEPGTYAVDAGLAGYDPFTSTLVGINPGSHVVINIHLWPSA